MTDVSIRVIIVEDEALFRDLLVSSLSVRDEIVVVAAYQDGTEVLANLSQDRPQVALVDIDLGPGDTGVQVALRMRQILPSIGIVFLSNYDEPGVLTAINRERAGGWAYLLKKSVSHLGHIVRAIEGVHDGLVVIDPRLVKALDPGGKGLVDTLTPRQHQVLELMAQGYSNAAIAERLVLQPKSVENLISQIYQGLGIDYAEGAIHARVKATLLFLDEWGR